MPGFSDLTISAFMNDLASKASTPGGGAGAAMGGALAASLLSMVCNLTLGKKDYESAQRELTEMLGETETLRTLLLGLADRDSEVYGEVMASYRLPRGTEQLVAKRAEAIQVSLHAAARVPLEIAEACAHVVDLALPAAELGNKWAVSDAGVAVLLAESSCHAALLNVVINLKSITDDTVSASLSARMQEVREGIAERKDAVLGVVDHRIRS